MDRNANDDRTARGEPAVDPRDAARQRQVHEDHEAMAESARRVEATAPPETKSPRQG